MGIAIIKGGLREYSTTRKILNVIPALEEYRTGYYLTNVSELVYSKDSNNLNIYKVININIGAARLPYIYKLVHPSNNTLVDSYTGIQINNITGLITVDSSFLGSSADVKVLAIESTYYPNTYTSNAFTVNIDAVPHEDVYSDLNVTLLFNGGNQLSNPTLQDLALTGFVLSGKLNGDDTTFILNPSGISTAISSGNLVISRINCDVNSVIYNTSNTDITDVTITKNTSSSARSFIISIEGTYKGVSFTCTGGSVTLPANSLNSISASYKSASAPIGTISKSDFTVTARYSNDPLNDVLLSTNDFSLSTTLIVEGSNTITVSYTYNGTTKTADVTITGTVELVYITGFASATPISSTYVTDTSPYITEPTVSGTTYTFEPSVVCSDNNTVRKLSEYNNLTNKVNYTISGSKLTTGSWGLSVATVDSNGNLVFDLSDNALENITNDAIIDYSAVQLTLTPASQEYNTVLYSTTAEHDIMKYEQVKNAFNMEGSLTINVSVAGGYSAESSSDTQFVKSSNGYHAELNLAQNQTYYIRVKLPNGSYFHLYLFDSGETTFPTTASTVVPCTKRVIVNNSSGIELYFIIVYTKNASGLTVAANRGSAGVECTILTKNT